MFDICYICLRGDRELRSIDDDLENFYDELCNYHAENLTQFCSECIYKLQKCYSFKKRCQLAVKTLTTWKKQKAVKKSIDFLYTEMPPSELSLCNKKKFKVYFSQSSNAISSNSTQTSTKTRSHIVTLNIPQDDENDDEHYDYDDVDIKYEKIKVELDTENNSEYKKDDETNNWQNQHDDEIDVKDNKIFVSKSLLNNHIDGDDYDDDDDINLKQLSRVNSLQNDQNDDEKIDEQPEKKSVKKRIKYKTVQFDRGELKKLLQRKFERFGEVKDDKGNNIDMNILLTNMDKLPERILKNIRNLCSGSGPFKPAAIRKLSDVQARFAKFETVFTTMYLSDPAQVWEEFQKRKQYIEYTSTEHRCETCVRGFKHAKTLDYHNKTYHDESAGTLICNYCQMRFKTKAMLTKHKALHSMIYKCKLCHFVTNYRAAMVKHHELHNGVTYTCKHCNKEFKSMSMLYSHCNKMHESKFICDLCARHFNTEKGLSIHKHLKHDGEEFVQSSDNTKCEECNIIFITNDVYNKHMSTMHEEKPEGSEALNKRKFRQVTISCRLCDSQGHSPGWLVGHFIKVHPTANMDEIYSSNKKYLCHDCGKGFSNSTSFKDHRNTHTGLKPYACTKCPKKFHKKMALRNHLERHLPASRECPYCGKMFVTASYLSSHMRIHINDRRYKCEICGKGFIYPATLREHVNGVHYNIKRKRKQTALE